MQEYHAPGQGDDRPTQEDNQGHEQHITQIGHGLHRGNDLHPLQAARQGFAGHDDAIGHKGRAGNDNHGVGVLGMSPQTGDKGLNTPTRHASHNQDRGCTPPVAAGVIAMPGHFPHDEVGQAQLAHHLEDDHIGQHDRELAQGFRAQKARDEHLHDHAEQNANATIDPEGQDVLGDNAHGASLPGFAFVPIRGGDAHDLLAAQQHLAWPP